MNIIEKLKELRACREAIKLCEDNDIQTLQEAWDKCERGDWMLWLYARLYPDNKRELILANGHCANTIRHLLKDETSIKAIDTAIRYGEGNATDEELKDSAAYSVAYFATTAAHSVSAAHFATYATYAYAVIDSDAAKKENQKLTADICRKYLSIKENER
jgi:hypothetical protein